MTWNAFVHQFEATGRDKADGYFPVHFEGMSDEERARARQMLENRGTERGDTTDLDGLRLVGDAGTVDILRAAESQDDARGLPFEAVRRETLFALTGDAEDLAPLLRRTDTRDEDDAKFAAQALARHPLPATLEPALAERIGDGRHEAALLPLLESWLSTQGVAIWEEPEFDRHLPFIREVKRAAPARRAALLAKRRAADRHG